MAHYPKGIQVNVQPKTEKDKELLQAKYRALNLIAINAGLKTITGLTTHFWDRVIVLTNQGMDPLESADAVAREIVAKAHRGMLERSRRS